MKSPQDPAPDQEPHRGSHCCWWLRCQRRRVVGHRRRLARRRHGLPQRHKARIGSAVKKKFLCKARRTMASRWRASNRASRSSSSLGPRRWRPGRLPAPQPLASVQCSADRNPGHRLKYEAVTNPGQHDRRESKAARSHGAGARLELGRRPGRQQRNRVNQSGRQREGHGHARVRTFPSPPQAPSSSAGRWSPCRPCCSARAALIRSQAGGCGRRPLRPCCHQRGHPMWKQRLLATGVSLRLCACASTPPRRRPAVDTQPAASGPKATPQRNVTHFADGLRCMDEMLFRFGVRDVSVMIEEMQDQSRRLGAGTRDMMVSAFADMTRRSRGVRLVTFGQDNQNVVQLLSIAQRLNDFKVVPQYDIRGSVTQFDEDVDRRTGRLRRVAAVGHRCAAVRRAFQRHAPDLGARLRRQCHHHQRLEPGARRQLEEHGRRHQGRDQCRRRAGADPQRQPELQLRGRPQRGRRPVAAQHGRAVDDRTHRQAAAAAVLVVPEAGHRTIPRCSARWRTGFGRCKARPS